MDDQYSFVVRLERRDGLPDEEYFFASERDGQFYFNLFTNPEECSAVKIYSSITFVKVDWINRRDEELDGIVFE